jgi:hypothetical protein
MEALDAVGRSSRSTGRGARSWFANKNKKKTAPPRLRLKFVVHFFLFFFFLLRSRTSGKGEGRASTTALPGADQKEGRKGIRRACRQPCRPTFCSRVVGREDRSPFLPSLVLANLSVPWKVARGVDRERRRKECGTRPQHFPPFRATNRLDHHFVVLGFFFAV